ncbi:hypothetical protein JHK82_018317 [Glycine max]|nr:hypothetical protein JHK86_018342 [Glycine max]KAG5142622.1 hypothetical protein JHK82_018317 [Glycine max]
MTAEDERARIRSCSIWLGINSRGSRTFHRVSGSPTLLRRRTRQRSSAACRRIAFPGGVRSRISGESRRETRSAGN